MTKSQDKRLLTLWSQKVRARDKHCQWIYVDGRKCQAKEVLHAHHLHGRQLRSTRWYLPNGVAACPLHHTFGQQSFHKTPLLAFERLRKEDLRRYRDLLRKAELIAKNVDPEKVQAHLEGKLSYYL